MPKEWTQDDLTRICAEWQRELHLLHWRIDVQFKRREVLEHNQGRVYVRDKLLEAEMEILDPRDRIEKPTFPYDIEGTIVHELLHIVLSDMSEGDSAGTREEQIVQNLSRTLTNLKRFFLEETTENVEST